MENKNSIVKFEDTELQITVNRDYELEMDFEELVKAIGFETKRGLEKILENHSELRDREFSYLKKVLNKEGEIIKSREKRIFTQDGIYEVALLANTERAKRFRKFARELISKFRKNEIIVSHAIPKNIDEKLDEMIEVVKDRDEEITEILDYLQRSKDKFEAIDEMKKDIKDMKSKIDELVDFVNDLADEVYGRDKEDGVDEEGDE